MRNEVDSLGSIAVPDEALYGAQTSRSLATFGPPLVRMPRDLLRAIVQLKAACARANMELGLLDTGKAEAILQACREARDGRFDDQFPLGMMQAGSGTSTNMNVNEVLASRACEILGGGRGDRALVHPNDDVNKGQSTNNIFPSAIRVAAVKRNSALMIALDLLLCALRDRESAFADIFKSGRTHLQDAVPMTLGQEFGAWARALEKDLTRLDEAAGHLRELGVGGNAIGTGMNTPRAFRPAILSALNAALGERFTVAENGIEITQFLTDLAHMSSMLRLLALDLQKLCNDLRLLASGPNTGFAEIILPAVEPGSSIMPGKVNPTVCEAVQMACLRVLGHDYAVAAACGAGQLELNTHMPLVACNLIESFQLLEQCCAVLSARCITDIAPNRKVCARHFERGAALATILNPRLGYDKATALVKEALAVDRPVRELAIQKGLLSAEEFDALARAATGPTDAV